MKRKLRVLFYGVTHEHAFGKYTSLSRLPDDFEIVAVADDRARAGAVFLDEHLTATRLVGIGVVLAGAAVILLRDKLHRKAAPAA